MKAKKKTKKTTKVEEKIVVKPEFNEKAKASQAKLEAYLRKNKLDPSKDWTRDKVHGANIRELLLPLKTVREKIKEVPKEKEEKLRPSKAKAPKKDKKEVTKYDYPKVDGKEMTPAEKKKYRIKMRREGKPSDAKSAKETKKPSKVEKKPTKVEKVKAKDVKKKTRNED